MSVPSNAGCQLSLLIALRMSRRQGLRTVGQVPTNVIGIFKSLSIAILVRPLKLPRSLWHRCSRAKRSAEALWSREYRGSPLGDLPADDRQADPGRSDSDGPPLNLARVFVPRRHWDWDG